MTIGKINYTKLHANVNIYMKMKSKLYLLCFNFQVNSKYKNVDFTATHEYYFKNLMCKVKP